MAGAYFASNTTNLFYTSHGDPTSPPILLIHGWVCDQLDWSFQIPFLLNLGFHVIALDLRGHGRSSALASPADTSRLYSPTALADDAAALLNYLKFTMPAIVMGHSLGSLIAAILAVEHPEQVRGLVLVDAAYYSTNEKMASLILSIRNSIEEAPATVVSAWETGAYTKRTPHWLKTLHKVRTWGMSGNVVAAVGEELYGKNESIGRWENAQKYLRKGLGAKTGGERVPRLAVVADEWKVDMERDIGLDEGAGDQVEVVTEGHWLHQQDAERFHGIVAEWLRERDLLP